MEAILEKLVYFVIVLLFIYIINSTHSLYSKLKHYPISSFPIPIFGNVLSLLVNLNRHPAYYFTKLAQKYGDVYTFWFGSEPLIVVNDCEIIKSLLSKSEFSDRFDETIQIRLNSIFASKNFILSNNDEEVKVMRKVSIEAIRKYLLNNKLSENIHHIVSETVEIMKKKKCGKQFTPYNYIDNIFIRLLIKATFGEYVSIDSPAIETILKYFEMLQENTMKIIASDYIPILKFIHSESTQNTVITTSNELMRNWYQKSFKTYDSESTESLSHLIISAKQRYLNNMENKMYENYLSESNITGILNTLMIAASDTSHHTFKWLLLLMAYYPEMQQKMRDEVNNAIGEKCTDSTDKEKCHFMNAFIAETLRFRNIAALAVFHRTKSNAYIGDKQIPKGVQIAINVNFLLNDPKYWQNPEIFNPQRFINSDECFDKTKFPAFIPFGFGKRMCIGEQFALNSLFLILTSFLQLTDGYLICLANKQNTSLEAKAFGYFIEPQDYKIYINKQ